METIVAVFYSPLALQIKGMGRMIEETAQEDIGNFESMMEKSESYFSCFFTGEFSVFNSRLLINAALLQN